MTTADPIPVPEQVDEDSVNDRRLWIGNLDLRITEFVLLKLIQRFGKPEKFDFIYHIAGPDKGKPKGYCFVTFPSKEIAEKAMRGLDGKLALSRRLIVHWARDRFQTEPVAPGVGGSRNSAEEKREVSGQSTESKIRAIEAKLSAMESTQKDFGLSELPAAPPGSNAYSCVHAAQHKATTSHASKKPYQRRRPPPHAPSHRGRRR